MSNALLIYTTWPDAESATAFAHAAVDTRLAACANLLAPMTSVYRWQGAVETAQEIPMLLKTTADRVEGLRGLFLHAHPYDTPAFVAVTLDKAGSHSAFLDWVGQQTEDL